MGCVSGISGDSNGGQLGSSKDSLSNKRNNHNVVQASYCGGHCYSSLDLLCQMDISCTYSTLHLQFTPGYPLLIIASHLVFQLSRPSTVDTANTAPSYTPGVNPTPPDFQTSGLFIWSTVSIIPTPLLPDQSIHGKDLSINACNFNRSGKGRPSDPPKHHIKSDIWSILRELCQQVSTNCCLLYANRRCLPDDQQHP